MNNLTLLKNIRELATLAPAHKKNGRNLLPEDLGIIKNASIIYSEDKILYVGDSDSIPQKYKITSTYDLSKNCLTPALVDAHTHLVFAGNRSNEYKMRLDGESYEKIAASGGGILATTSAVINSSRKDNIAQPPIRI